MEAATAEADETVVLFGERFEGLDAGLIDDLTPQFDAWQEAAMSVISQAASGAADQSAEELVASLVPAYRAAAVNPVTALRQD